MKEKFDQIVHSVGRIIFGKSEQVWYCLTCLFAGGHLLIEDIPGIGKTTLAKALSTSLGLEFRRIQFTSDLLPGDIVGVSIFEKKSQSFVFHPGPIFTQVLLADEINRATPKTQSALLEAMEERQVTVEGSTRTLSPPFFVIATQNPKEQSGTFRLPESQLDRFLMRIHIGYPDRESEMKLLEQGENRQELDHLRSILSKEDVLEIQKKIPEIHTSRALLEYVQDIIDFTRDGKHFLTGLSPRAGMGLLRTSQSWAYVQGRDHVLPEDVQQMLPLVVGHRLRSLQDGRELLPDALRSLLMSVPVP